MTDSIWELPDGINEHYYARYPLQNAKPEGEERESLEFEGDSLPDPEGLLQGTGSMVRSIRLTDPKQLDSPAVKALIAAAADCAQPPLDQKARRKIVLRQSTRLR